MELKTTNFDIYAYNNVEHRVVIKNRPRLMAKLNRHLKYYYAKDVVFTPFDEPIFRVQTRDLPLICAILGIKFSELSTPSKSTAKTAIES